MIFDYTEIISILLSSILVFLYLMKKNSKCKILLSIGYLAGSSLFVYILKHSGIEKIVQKAVFSVLSVLFNPSMNDSFVILNNFSVKIGFVCSGIVFMAMFIPIFLILSDKRKKKTLLLFFSLLGLIAINITRICMIIVIGAYYDKELAISLFHSSIGLLLFLVYTYFISRWLSIYHPKTF